METIVVTLIGGVMGLIQLWVNQKHSTKLAMLERDHAECKAQLAETKIELAAVKALLIARDTKDREDINAKMRDLETRLKDAGSLPPGTKSHTPLE